MIPQEIESIVEVCRRFSAGHIAPGSLEADHASDVNWVSPIWKNSHEIGIPALVIPESHGGVGQGALCAALVLDSIAADCAGMASVFLHHFVACLCVNETSWPGRDEYLAGLTGKNSPAAGIIFPSRYDDRKYIIKEQNGGLLISGKSPVFCNYHAGESFIAFMDTSENDILCAVIDKNIEGVAVEEDCRMSGLKANPFLSCNFNHAGIAAERILARGDAARKLCDGAYNAYYGLIAACGIGAARSAYNRAFAYATERFQYGNMIIRHQEIQRMLGNMLTGISVGKASYVRSCSAERPGLSGFGSDCRFSKIYCTDSALQTAMDAVQIHGGYGYTHDYGVEKIMRDVKTLQLLGGSTPVMQIQAINQIL